MKPLTQPDDRDLRLALRTLAAEISSDRTPPPASTVWLRAERARRSLAIERATRPLRIMQTLGLLAAIVAAAWALHQTLLSSSSRAFAAHGLTPLLELGALTLALAVAGGWTLLLASRDTRQTTNHS